MSLLDQAWERFKKAENFDEKATNRTLSDSLRRVAAKGVDKALGEAVALEERALAAGESHTA